MWDELKKASKPIVLYGTGDAAEKILKELDARSIRVSGIFASEGFVRDREFAGFKVTDYETAKRSFGDMIVLLCFGSHRPEVMENMQRISREQDLYAPDLPIAGEQFFDRAFYEQHRDRLNAVRDRLADRQSRLVFDKVIEYKLSGRIDPLVECSTPEDDNWRLFLNSGNGLSVPDLNSGDGHSALQAPADGGALFADLGAYTGDTVDMFRKIRGNAADTIVAFEPEPRNFRKLSENLAGLENTELINAAAWDSDGEAVFGKGRGRGTHEVVSKGVSTPLRSVDSVLSGRRADFIKMDIEGAEHRAILGAAQTIKDHKSALLIAAYHRAEDLFDIPETVLSIRPDYRLYLRKDPAIPAWGVNYIFV